MGNRRGGVCTRWEVIGGVWYYLVCNLRYLFWLVVGGFGGGEG